MKLRIRENSVRLRLTKREVAEFAEKGLIENVTEFGDSVLIYALKTYEQSESFQAKFENGRIEIIIPQTIAKNWTDTEEVGISGATKSLKILTEKDFACLTQREGEHETDAYMNPAEKVC